MNIPYTLFRLLLGKRLPVTSGEIKLAGVKQPVSIRRDLYGIPVIEAQNDADAWYGLGFCQGQDRAFQLESLLRVVRGTLAELVGEDGLPVDRLSRRIGFYHAAEQQLDALDADVREMLEAFARGVTDGATLGCKRPPPEFALLRAKPTPYTAVDVLGLLKLISFLLASNWDTELVRYKILMEDGPEALAALDPPYPDWLPVTTPPAAAAGPALDRLAEDLRLFTETVGHGGGSNNWAIAPERAANGRPILANDPHLAPTAPPHWYLAHARTPEWAVAGATFLGSPGFPAGFNGYCAWGVTAGLTDNTDLFIEEIGEDGASVRVGDTFVPCVARHEIIHVKGGAFEELQVLETPHGPLVGPAMAGEVGAIALKATWLQAKPVRGFLATHKARSFEAYRQCFADWPALPMNMVYADAEGNIGWQLVGEAPRRRKGWGTIPLPGSDPDAGWEDDPVPFAEMPHALNPDVGFIATANNKPKMDGDGPYLGTDWIDGYRLARIDEVLSSRQDWDVAGTMALQVDQLTIPWREMKETVLAAQPADEAAQKGLALLREWNGVLDVDTAAGSVYVLFTAEMMRRLVQAKAPKAAEWALGGGLTPLTPHSIIFTRRMGHLVRLLREKPEGWFATSWEEEMGAALAAAVNTLRAKYGADEANWGWGKVRPLTLLHPAGAKSPADKVFNLGPFPWGGDASTVGQAAAAPTDPTGGPTFIASMRMVVEVGNWDENRFVLPGGQSGNPFSPHYADMLPLWREGQGVSIPWSPEMREKAAQERLILQPE